MRIVQIAPGPYSTVNGRLVSELASVRLRAIEPGLALERLGHPVRFVAYTKLLREMRSGALADGDVFVFQKAMYDVAGVIDWLHARGRPVVVDVCDDVFQLPKHREHYPDMIRAADAVTAATDAMAERIRAATGRDATVIPDCLEGAAGTAASDPAADGVLRLLWFGRAPNLVPLIDRLPALAPARLGLPVRLQVVCNDTAAFAALRAAMPAGLELTVSRWSLEAVETALAACHLVVLPSDDHPVRTVKSANRLERSLWAARPVVASPAAVHAPYRDVAFLDTDLAGGIAAALADWPATLRRTAEGQAQVAATRSPAALAPHWLAALAAAAAPRPAAPAGRRLAVLGDGRALAGWINALPGGTLLPGGSRHGDFDLVVDLQRPLPVAEASLDRLLVVGRDAWTPADWQAALAGWIRCLRPGATLIVQWPVAALPERPLAGLLARAGLHAVRTPAPLGYRGDPAQERAAGQRPAGA